LCGTPKYNVRSQNYKKKRDNEEEKINRRHKALKNTHITHPYAMLTGTRGLGVVDKTSKKSFTKTDRWEDPFVQSNTSIMYGSQTRTREDGHSAKGFAEGG
jgi:hypothetical protein